MTVVAAPYTLHELDLSAPDDADVASLAQLNVVLSRERVPEDPDFPRDLVELRIRNRPAVMDARDWLVKAGDDVVATANLTRWLSPGGNPHWRDSWIGVHPEHRGHGLATRLLRKMVDACAGDDEIILASSTNDRVPAGGEFARRLAATEGLVNRTSRVALKDIDRALVAEWSRLDPPGYRLVWVDEDVPDELMPNVMVAYTTMNTAPRGDLQFGDFEVTADEVRQWERSRKATGYQHRLLLAIEDATGATAGFTEVAWHPDTPWQIGQNGTAVVPEHRGRGIGKWIKARMIERIFRERGDALFIGTGNAYVNAPMLSINDRLGFTVAWSVIVWQLKIADARAYLERRGL